MCLRKGGRNGLLTEYFDKNDSFGSILPLPARLPFPTITDRNAWQNIPDKTKKRLIIWGNKALKGYPQLTASQYMAYKKSGNRTVFEAPYFERRKRLIGAALAECVSNSGTYLNAIIDGLWLLCEESTWVISAHNGDGSEGGGTYPLPYLEKQNIDLFSAQTAATLAHTYTLLGERLDEITPQIGKRIYEETNRRILTPFLERDDFWWMGGTRKNLNNWTPWILSNVIDTFLLMETNPERLTTALKRAICLLDRYLSCQPADGGCDEGCGYWNMAGGSLLDCLESLRLATGGKADCYGEPLLRHIAAFPLAAHIAGPWYWNFADCDAKPILDGERVYTFGIRTKQPQVAALGQEIFNRHTSPVPRDTPQMNRVLFSLFNPCKPRIAAAKAMPDRAVFLPDLQVRAVTRGDFYVAVKGGNNGESHNHNDVGSLIIAFQGEPCVVDAGNRVYTTQTFSDDRYSLWNTRAAYHNLPMINDIEQREGAQYRAEHFSELTDGAKMEFSSAYPPEAGLKSFIRTVTIKDGVTVCDQLALEHPQTITWVWMLRDRPGTSSIRHGQRELPFGPITMRYPTSLTCRWEEIPVTDKRMARNYKGSLYRVLLQTEPTQAMECTFTFVKGNER